MKIRLSFFLITLLVQLGNCEAEATENCPVRQNAEVMKRTYSGRYVNLAEGFDVLIPRSLVGRDVEDPAYQRGFTILFQDPEESLSVDGEPNSLYWKDAREAAEANARAYRDDGRKITSSKRDLLVLDGRRAFSITSSYNCPDSSIQYSSITTFVLGIGREYIYELRWEGKTDKLEKGRKIMHLLYSTWHFRKPTG